MHATWGHEYWTWALIAIALLFLPAELYALFTNTANTLTDYSRYELHVSGQVVLTRQSAAWVLTLGTYLVVTTWLCGHIWFDLWSG
ncbi:MAG: hypothetical protein ACRD22_02725 [Terriglobia bacterium]